VILNIYFVRCISLSLSPLLEWKKLEGENLKWVEENQWPPKSYLKELEDYQRALEEYKRETGDTSAGKTCSIM
jgi:hypothetical protein